VFKILLTCTSVLQYIFRLGFLANFYTQMFIKALRISTFVVNNTHRTFNVRKIIRQNNSWAAIPTSKIPYGRTLAVQLATKLWANNVKDFSIDCFGIFSTHRDYCGHGLGWLRTRNISKLVISEVYDGYFSGPAIMAWSADEQNEFTSWLALQSDFSLSGCDQSSVLFYNADKFFQNNQRITESSIKEFLTDSQKI
jgi:hypothetical protein